MKIRTRGDEVDITLGTRFVEVYANSRFGPVVFMEAISEPVVQDEFVSWDAVNMKTAETVSYGVHLKSWQYSPALYMIHSAAFNEGIQPFRPWPREITCMGLFTNQKKFKREKPEEDMNPENPKKTTLQDLYSKDTPERKLAKRLYKTLSNTNFNDSRGYAVSDLGDGIFDVKQDIGG